MNKLHEKSEVKIQGQEERIQHYKWARGRQEWESMMPKNGAELLLDYTASHSRRHYNLWSVLGEPKIKTNWEKKNSYWH